MNFRIILIFCLFLPLIASCSTTSMEGKAKQKTITMETTLGKMVLELYDDKAPLTCENFRRYVRDGFYDGLVFHRVIPGFVIQGGGFEPGMKMRAPKYSPIKNEAANGLKNNRYTLSMARTSNINSATSQFFVNLKHNASLDHVDNSGRGFGYAVFGKVIEGMEVVDKIAAVPTTMMKGFSDVPRQDMVIIKAYEN